jgi:hypothetical protein
VLNKRAVVLNRARLADPRRVLKVAEEVSAEDEEQPFLPPRSESKRKRVVRAVFPRRVAPGDPLEVPRVVVVNKSVVEKGVVEKAAVEKAAVEKAVVEKAVEAEAVLKEREQVVLEERDLMAVRVEEQVALEELQELVKEPRQPVPPLRRNDKSLVRL